MNPEDVQEHHAEEIHELNKRIEELERKVETNQVLVSIAYYAALDNSNIKKVIEHVKKSNNWSNNQEVFIERLLESIDKYI